nr:hypothetical protein [Rubrivivax gelatinosus]
MQAWLFDEDGGVREHARGTAAGVALLARLGVDAGRVEIEPDADSGHHAALDALRRHYGIVHEDRVTVRPGDPAWPPLRARFLEEHTHADLELRVFVNGRGLFPAPATGSPCRRVWPTASTAAAWPTSRLCASSRVPRAGRRSPPAPARRRCRCSTSCWPGA